ncbi:MAG: CARDB domain-containing protein [Candidatus Aenigmatarchaeota archaeon]
MKTYLFFLFILISSIIFYLPETFALSCAVRSGNCNANETCLFSMLKLNNSHIGDCNQYNYKVCCDRLISAIRDNACNADEGIVLSMYSLSNSHAGSKGYFAKKVCGKFNNTNYGVECNIRSSCLTDEACVVSLYQHNNSHAATCDYYSNKICCAALPDLLVDQTSITPNNTSPDVGDPILFNITVWNIGDAAATQVNISCYANGNYFDSNIINSIPPDASKQTPRYTTCTWISSCPSLNVNISVKVDAANQIRELNESNNEAWKLMNLTETLNIRIDNPVNGSSHFRGTTLNLNSTVGSNCSTPPTLPFNVTWYNESTQIATGQHATWQIPLEDFILGSKIINATATSIYYHAAWNTSNIIIKNNLPRFTGPNFNVTPPEIEAGQGIQISCDVTDVEDTASQLITNISVKDAAGVWSNVSASNIGNTFYRDYATTDTSPLGNYTAVCSAVDHNNGYNESATAQFLVFQNATVTLNLNSTYYWWNDAVFVYGNAKRKDGSPIDTSTSPIDNVTVLVDGEKVCMTDTNSSGDYNCTFTSPSSVGNYSLVIRVPDPLTGKVFRNSTTLFVNPTYGGSETGVREKSCFGLPQLIVNPDGTIKMVIVRICVWK